MLVKEAWCRVQQTHRLPNLHRGIGRFYFPIANQTLRRCDLMGVSSTVTCERLPLSLYLVLGTLSACAVCASSQKILFILMKEAWILDRTDRQMHRNPAFLYRYLPLHVAGLLLYGIVAS